MKNIRSVTLLLAGGLALLSGCATNPNYVADGPRFHDEINASLVVRYSSENTVFKLRPGAYEGPFHRIYSRQELCEELASLGGDRGVAIVIINRFPMRDVELLARQQWVDSLSRLNFSRVIFLRGTDQEHINGLRIVNETILAGGNPAQPAISGTEHAAGIASAR